MPDLTLSQNMRLAQSPARKRHRLPGGDGHRESRSQRLCPRSSTTNPTSHRSCAGPCLRAEGPSARRNHGRAALRYGGESLRVMRRWRERGHAVIFISHRMAEVSAICDRTTVLRDGATVGVTETASGSQEQIVSLMLGTDIAKAAQSVAQPGVGQSIPKDEPPTLEVRGMGLRICSMICPSAFALAKCWVSRRWKGRVRTNCSIVSRACDASTAGRSWSRERKSAFATPATRLRLGWFSCQPIGFRPCCSSEPFAKMSALPMFRSPRSWGPTFHGKERRGTRAVCGDPAADRYARRSGTATVERRQ